MIRAGEAATESRPPELGHALQVPDEGFPGAALAGVEHATAATDRAEWAHGVFEALTAGKGPSLEQLQAPVDQLLALLQKLDSEGRYEDALKLARAASGLLALVLRWVDLVRSLRVAGRAAEALNDVSGIAWARHEIGTLQLVAGDAAGADLNLSAARELRQQLGDRAGLAATQGNLQVLCRNLRQALHEQKPTPTTGPSTPRRALPFAIGLALLCAGGVAGAVVGGGGEDQAIPAKEALAPAGITIRAPVEGARYKAEEKVVADFRCSTAADGPQLESCVGTAEDGNPLDTGEGAHTFRVTATTKDGRQTIETVGYSASRSAPVDKTHPVIQIGTPEYGAVFKVGERHRADYSCTDEAGVTKCDGTADDGDVLSTKIGDYELEVVAVDAAGNEAVVRHPYSVVGGRTRPEPEICDDKLDNDQDTLTDLRDDDCRPGPKVVPPSDTETTPGPNP